MSDQEDAGSERRRAARIPVSIPTRIDTELYEDRFGMARDLSITGALLATPNRLRIGDRASLAFRLPSGRAAVMPGQIVRLQLDTDDETGVARYLAAIHFTAPLPAALHALIAV